MSGFVESTSYTIGEAADLLGISIATLRVYEIHGLVIPQRRKSGHRRYASMELDRVRRIRSAVRGKRFTIETLRDFFARYSVSNRQACMAEDLLHLPCWMHPTLSGEARSSRCRLCSIYTEVIEAMEGTTAEQG